MNAIEDRLRDAYQGAAQSIRPDSIEHLHDQALRRARAASPATFRRGRTGNRSRSRLLVPLAAAAAVALIAVAASLVIPGGHGRGSAARGQPPRFFLAMPNTATGDHMAVFSATTGRQLALISPPSRDSVIDTAAATGNDRTFVVTVQTGSRCSTTELFRLRLTAQGRPGNLVPLAVPKISGVVTAMAVTPDGRTIAYATSFCARTAGDDGAIGVVHAATGQRAQWKWRPKPGQSTGSVTITADGRLIEYAASPNKILGHGAGAILPVRTIRLLPADAPPGTAGQRSRAVVTLSRQAPAELFSSAAISADGRTLYFCTQRNAAHPARSALVLRAYDVATAATSVLHTFDWPGAYCMLGASGSHLLVGLGIAQQRHSPRLARYDVSTGQLTQVPVPRQWDEIATNIPW